jgi:hypothetical protein
MFNHKSTQVTFFFFFFKLGLTLARQALYHLSHASSLFGCGYFGDGVCMLFAQPASNLDPPNLSLPSIYVYRREPPVPSLAHFLVYAK